MSEVPVRLVVISARVPDGATCDGCQYLGRYRDAWECLLYHHEDGACLDIPDPPIRLPACRARDGWEAIPPAPARDVGDDYRLAAFLSKQRGWACYPPGSGVPELVEAAKRWAASSERSEWEGDAAVGSVLRAARKVAGEGER